MIGCLFWLLCVLRVVCVDLVELVVCYGLDGVVYYCVFVTLGVGVLEFAGLIVWLLWLWAILVVCLGWLAAADCCGGLFVGFACFGFACRFMIVA